MVEDRHADRLAVHGARVIDPGGGLAPRLRFAGLAFGADDLAVAALLAELVRHPQGEEALFGVAEVDRLVSGGGQGHVVGDQPVGVQADDGRLGQQRLAVLVEPVADGLEDGGVAGGFDEFDAACVYGVGLGPVVVSVDFFQADPQPFMVRMVLDLLIAERPGDAHAAGGRELVEKGLFVALVAERGERRAGDRRGDDAVAPFERHGAVRRRAFSDGGVGRGGGVEGEREQQQGGRSAASASPRRGGCNGPAAGIQADREARILQGVGFSAAPASG